MSVGLSSPEHGPQPPTLRRAELGSRGKVIPATARSKRLYGRSGASGFGGFNLKWVNWLRGIGESMMSSSQPKTRSLSINRVTSRRS